jgi:hypothetical protein
MKKSIYIAWLLLIVVTSCKDDDLNLFDKPADQRSAEAIAALRSALVAPDNGWKIKYQPEDGSGSFWVLLDFDEDNNVTIRSDLGAEDGKYFEQTVTYRVDNSLGLELIIESYSFFAFLFEQDQATFLAEYEFDYVNETPDKALVFTSKSDPSNPTILLFEKAEATDHALLGTAVASNLNEMADDLENFTPTLKLTYEDRDLIFYLSLNELRRTIHIKSASRKTNTTTTQTVDFVSTYLIEGQSIILDEVLTGTFFGSNISIESIAFEDALGDSEINVCADPIGTHVMQGTTSGGDEVSMEPTLLDANGKNFTSSDFYNTPIQNIFDNGFSARNDILEDITGAVYMQLYYNNDGFYAIGFYIQNLDGTVTWALREFVPVLTDNKIVFNFAPTITIFGNPTTGANLQNINIYLNAITEGNTTYVFQYAEGIYEFYNPCTGWSAVFLDAN